MRSLLLAAAFLATLSFACSSEGTATSPGGPDQTSTPPTDGEEAPHDDAADAGVPHDVESDGGLEDASIDGGTGTLCGSGAITPADSQMACATAAAPPSFMDPSACSGAFTFTSGTWEARCFADGSVAIEATFVAAAGHAYLCFYEAGSQSGNCVLDADGTVYAPPTSSPDLVLRSFVEAPGNPASRLTSATLLVTGPAPAAPGDTPKLRFIGGASLSWH